MRSHLASVTPIDPNHRRAPADDDRQLLDTDKGFLGIGRSLTFPFPQWRANDRYRTVYFDEGEGPPLVMVHGLGANATHWEKIAEPLSKKYRVIGLDLVGLGWSEKPNVPYDIPMLRDHLLEFLDDRGIRNATLLGHSLGGAVCLAAALQRPAQFDGLVLVCAAGVAPLPRWMRAAAPVFLHRRLLFATLGVTANFIVNNIFVDRPEENDNVRWFRESAMRDAKGWPNLMEFTRVCETLCRDVIGRDYRPHFPSMQLPVMALWGDTDKLTTLPGVLRSLNAIRRVRTVILERTGHMPMIERPEEFIFHLERFIKNPP